MGDHPRRGPEIGSPPRGGVELLIRLLGADVVLWNDGAHRAAKPVPVPRYLMPEAGE